MKGRFRQPPLLALLQITVLTTATFFGFTKAFSSTTTPNAKAQLFATETSQNSTPSNPTLHVPTGIMTKDYTDQELKQALGSLLEDSKDPKYDARHIFGYGDDNHKMSMLQRITATRILDYKEIMTTPESPAVGQLLQQAKEFALQHGPILNLKQVIQLQSPRMALAAEFKRASPSKGDIATHLNAGEQAKTYALAGANIISVLTEHRWFKGTLADMTEARLQTTGLAGICQRPAILRKEFVTETYQIAEAAAAGADTILLIVAVLPQHVLKRLIDYARDVVGMEPLVEVHGDAELDVAIQAGAKVVGVNNRNLHTFQLDLGTSQHVAAELTKRGIQFDHNDKNADYSLCALSGMSNAMDVQRYRQVGLGMCLIGESLMRASDPAAAIASLCLHPDDFERANAHTVGGAYTAGTKLIKVCGNTRPDDALKACQEGANLIGIIFVPKSKRCVTPDQAKDIVKAVRKFGERTHAAEFPDRPSYDSPLRCLVDASITLQEAARRPLVVGVFQNQEPEYIKKMVSECGLDMVQLHGKEGMEAANIANCGVPAIRVVDIETDPATGKVTSNAVENLLESLTCDPIAILLDTSIKGCQDGGGTGVIFDWSIAEKIQNMGLPVIIAGGLTPENVKEAVASVRPWGVDVSSGVEESPGKKDLQKVQDFVRGAKEAAQEASKGF